MKNKYLRPESFSCNRFSIQERRQVGLIISANLLDAFRILLDIMATENIEFTTESAKVVPSFVVPFCRLWYILC